jgi:hypothetical protein
MSMLGDQTAIYAAQLQVASVRAGPLGPVVAGGWLVFPFGVATVMHPTDAIRLQSFLEGHRLPHVYAFTAQQAAAGFIEALFGLAALTGFQLVCTVLFYRRAQLLTGGPVAAPALWPLAAFCAGILGNAAWLVGTGAFDLGGCIIGLSSAALTVGGEILCENLGRDFVFGRAQPGQLHP